MVMATKNASTYIFCDASKIRKTSHLKFNDLPIVNIPVTDYNGPEVKKIRIKRNIGVSNTHLIKE